MTDTSSARSRDLTGAALSHAYWTDVVAPLLERHAPGVRYAAARLGSGSDVLGYDDEQSRDHDWGLRLTLLVEEGADEIDALLERELPTTWREHPTRFATTWEPVVRQRCETAPAAEFARSRLGVDASDDLSLTDWLSLTGQAVLEVTGGPVFHDGTGAITAIRERLTWYPRDVWLYAVDADWSRLGQEFPFVGRAGLRGDDAGSRVIAARLVRTMMHLTHLLHRRWAPYSKWLGRAAAELLHDTALLSVTESHPGADVVATWQRALSTSDWRQRQDALAEAADMLARMQREAGLPTATPATEAFWDRPHHGIREAMSIALREAICDPVVAALPYGRGTAEQISDNVAVLVDPALRRLLVSG